MIWYDVDAALAEVPVNTVPLMDDTDFKTIETGVAYNAGGMALYWHFVTPAGAYTATAVTPTTAGTYDWAHQQQGMYTIEIPASGGASINNDTEGFGWFTGFATGVLPWRGPTVGFRAAGANDALVEAWSATRGAAGTALPAAAADAAGGLIVSDAGGLDADAMRSDVAAILVDTGTTLQGELDGIQADTEDIQSRLPAALTGDGNIKADTLRVGGTLQTAGDIIGDTNDIQSKIGTPGDFGSGTSTIAANLQDMADNGTAVFDRSTDSLQALRDHIADGTNLTEAGGTGDHLTALATQASVNTIDGIVDDILVDTAVIGALGAGLTAIPWNASWDAEVQSEVQDALDAAVSEITSVPADNCSLAQAIKYNFMRSKNKAEQTATTQTVYQGDGTTVFEVSTVSDDGTTFTRGEFATA